MERKEKLRGWMVGAGLLATSACATATPPRELVDARAAYARAARAQAAELAPARLQLARQALEEAELTFGGYPEPIVRDRAYVALRRAEAAEAEAEAIAIERERMSAERAVAEAARARASRSQAALEAERQARAAAAAQAGASQAALEAERQARQEAEGRAREAFERLARETSLRQEARGLVLTLSGSVLFASGQWTLLPSATKRLESVAEAIKAAGLRDPIVIEGHTDSRGSNAANALLSQRRAEAVREFLVARGVPADRLVARGVGEDRPVAENRSAEGRANNRRVEIVLPSFAGLSGAPR
jgi:outer membrane protein OmpA-like peptidoglycan-associated protein